MSHWIAVAACLVIALFLWVNGALMLFDLRKYFALQDWLTRADRWGSKRDPNWIPEHVGQWRVAGVCLLIMGTIVASTLLHVPSSPEQPRTPVGGAPPVSELLSPLPGFFLVCFGLWIVFAPVSFVRWVLRSRQGRAYPWVDFDGLRTQPLVGVRLFGLLFVVGGILAMVRW